MPALRITVRDTMAGLVAALDGFSADQVTKHKLDKVEGNADQASVYLLGVDNNFEDGAMKGMRARELRVNVSLFLTDAAGDAEAKCSDLLNDLEKAVYAAKSTFGVSSIDMESATVAHDPNSQGKTAEVHATFLSEFTESLS